MDKRAIVISSYYQKGGVGKTAFSVNFAACLSTLSGTKPSKENKNRVLFIDFDPHISASAYFQCTDSKYTIYDVLKQKVSIKDAIINKIYAYGRYGNCIIDVIPSTDLMHNIDDQYYDFPFLDGQFKHVLEEVMNDYDYIIIDCPPEKDNIFKLVFNATDYFILAADAVTVTIERLPQTYSLIREITTLKEPGKILGICFNKFIPTYCVDNINKTTCNDVAEMCKQYMHVFDNKIPNSSEVNSSFTNRTPIPFYHKNLHKCKKINSAFMHITIEILNEIKKYESE